MKTNLSAALASVVLLLPVTPARAAVPRCFAEERTIDPICGGEGNDDLYGLLGELGGGNRGSAASARNSSRLFVKPAGDLDRDGRRDALGIRRQNDGLHVVAIRGVDGSTLWVHSQEGASGTAYPARLGELGRAGVLVVSHHARALGNTFAIELRLTALAGSGEPIWERSFTGHLAFGPTGGGGTTYRLPSFEGVLNGSPGQAVNLLVARNTTVGISAGSAGKSYTRSEAEIVAGGDGSTVSRAVREDEDRRVWPAPTADLDDDGLQDFAFIISWPFHGTRPLPALSVHASSDGRRLWQRDGLELEAVWLAPVGDASGDGVPDVAVTDACRGCYFDAVHSLPFFGHPGATVVLLDGSNGKIFWSKRIGPPIRLGDVDDDGRTEVGGQTIFNDGGDYGIEYVALDADRDPDFRRFEVPERALERRMYGRMLFPYAGDADSDGVPDSYHSVMFGNSRAPYVESGLVSGRNGSKIWEGPAGIPVGATIDGSGDDLVLLERSRRVVRVVAQDGATGAVLWRSQISLRTEHDDGVVAIAADLTGDGRGEVIVKFDPLRNYPTITAHTFVLDGVTGSMLWSR